MARLITLSRAARLVGVKRATLQNQIRAGELTTFEGQLDLSELLRVYPQTQVEDNSMLEHTDRIIERALSRVVRDQDQLPDAEVLATRVAALSHELGTTHSRIRRYDILMQQLRDYLHKLSAQPSVPENAIQDLTNWLDSALEQLNQSADDDSGLYASDMLLRVMAAQVHLQPSQHEYFVNGNESLLESGLRAGLALDYGCSNGSCGRCKAKLSGGTVKLIRKPRYRLSDTERAQRYLLMCCCTAVTDVWIEATETPAVEQLEVRSLQAGVDAIERLEQDTIALSLRPRESARLRFFAGQSVRLSLDDKQAEYPIASCPCDEHRLEFHITPRAGDDFARQLFAGIGLEQSVQVEGPYGNFVLDEDSAHSIIFLAFDSGFAPIKSLIEHAMALDCAEHLHLYWVHSRGTRPYLHNRCRAWDDALENFHYTPLQVAASLYGQDATASAQQASLFAAVAEPHFDVSMFDFYIAAPSKMIEQSLRYLAARGVPAAQIRTFVMQEP